MCQYSMLKWSAPDLFPPTPGPTSSNQAEYSAVSSRGPSRVLGQLPATKTTRNSWN